MIAWLFSRSQSHLGAYVLKMEFSDDLLSDSFMMKMFNGQLFNGRS